MEITHRTVDGIDVLELNGRFDAYEAPAFVEWFDTRPHVKHLIVNLRGVGFIDSTGLSTLVKGLKHCRGNGGDLYICHMQQAVLIIFKLTRLDKAFSIFEDEAAAITTINTVNT